MTKTPDEPKEQDISQQYYALRSKAWVASLIATPLLSLVASAVTAHYTAKAASSGADVELTKLALEVLRDPSSSGYLDSWAIDVLGAKSGRVLNADEKEQMINELNIKRATTGVSVNDIDDSGILGGPNSEIRRITQSLVDPLSSKESFNLQIGAMVEINNKEVELLSLAVDESRANSPKLI